MLWWVRGCCYPRSPPLLPQTGYQSSHELPIESPSANSVIEYWWAAATWLWLHVSNEYVSHHKGNFYFFLNFSTNFLSCFHKLSVRCDWISSASRYSLSIYFVCRDRLWWCPLSCFGIRDLFWPNRQASCIAAPSLKVFHPLPRHPSPPRTIYRLELPFLP